MKTKKTIYASNLLSEIIATMNLGGTFQAVYQRRRKGDHNNDISSLSINWLSIRSALQTQLLTGCYPLFPVEVFRTDDGYFTRWCSQDAVVLKAISQNKTYIGRSKSITTHRDNRKNILK